MGDRPLVPYLLPEGNVQIAFSDEGGTLRVRDLLTDSLELVVPAATPDPTPASPLSAQRER